MLANTTGIVNMAFLDVLEIVTFAEGFVPLSSILPLDLRTDSVNFLTKALQL